MSITPASLLQKPRKILNTGNYEKYNLFERFGLRLFATDVRELASDRNSWLFHDLILAFNRKLYCEFNCHNLIMASA